VHDPFLHGETLDLLFLPALGQEVLFHEPRFGLRALVAISTPPPEKRMEPEEGEGASQQGNHEGIGPVEHGVPLGIQWIGMGNKGKKTVVEALVASAAGLLHPVGMHGGQQMTPRQDVVAAVTVGAAGHPLGITDVEDLAVIGVVEGGYGLCGKAVAFVHLRVVMTGTAPAGVIFPGSGNIPLQGGIVIRGVVQSVTVHA